MYVVRSEKERKASVVQMELSDFFGGPKRKIVFNADDSKEAKRAERILKPKGLRRARKKPQKVKPQRQKGIEEVLPSPSIKDLKAKKGPAKKESKNHLKNTSSEIEKGQKSIANRRKKVVEQKPLEKPLEKPNQQITTIFEKSTLPPPISLSNSLNLQPQKNSSPLGEVNPNFLLQAPPPDKKSPEFILAESILKELGKGGDLEVECPFCSDTIFFRYEDIDAKKKASTRICSCDAIARISIQQSNRGVFSDLKIQNFDIASQVRKHKNPLLDEYNNEIITYAFLNRAEK